MQARICTRLQVRLVSTPFEDRSYYVNIRKALVAGFFMQVRWRGRGACSALLLLTDGEACFSWRCGDPVSEDDKLAAVLLLPLCH